MILMVQVFKNKVLLAPTTVPGGGGAGGKGHIIDKDRQKTG